MTWGFEVAQTEFYPPQMYLAIFLVAMPGQYLFGVTPMTMAAVTTTFVFSAVYYAATGSYFFFDSHVPIAVFLGMHLLFTDPATSPRTELGRIMFGVLYGLAASLLYNLLLARGDARRSTTSCCRCRSEPRRARHRSVRVATGDVMAPSRAIGRALTPMRRSFVWVSVWVVAFIGMSSAQALGDYHPEQTVPFWYQACDDQRRGGCHGLGVMQSLSCRKGSGWACNELGVLSASGRVVAAPPAELFRRACALNFKPGCDNVNAATSGAEGFKRADPGLMITPICFRRAKGPCRSCLMSSFLSAGVQSILVRCVRRLRLAVFPGEPRGRGRPRARRGTVRTGVRRRARRQLLQPWFDAQTRRRSSPDQAKALGKLKRACDLGMSDGLPLVGRSRGRSQAELRVFRHILSSFLDASLRCFFLLVGFLASRPGPGSDSRSDPGRGG